MSKPTFARPGDTSEPPVDDRLESWKEIASYLGRDIRTVYRWEADEALPVHRHLHKKRGTVYAYKTELDDWRNKRSSVESVRAESPMEHSGDSKPELAGPTDRHETAKLAVAGVVILGVAAIVVTGWQRSPATTLTDRDVLVLAEFSNSTGEPVFDVTLREALAAQLEESPFLMIMSDDQVGEDLRLMGRASGEHVSNQVAREICLREGNKATIGGSIVGLGKTYAITVQATNCQTGETLARQQAEAEDKEHVLRAIAAAASGIRAKLGESLGSIQKLDPRGNVQVTTPSLEAYRAYALGREQDNQTAWLPAIAFYQRATELDPSFAMAYLLLGQKFNNLGEISRRREYFKKAFALIDRVSERERLFISALYYDQVTLETDKSAEMWQSDVRLYPRESTPHNYLGGYYMYRGEYAKAAEQFHEAVRLDPRDAVFRGNLMWALAGLGRPDDAKAAAQKAFEERVDGFSIHRRLLHLAYVQGDRAAAAKEISTFAGTPQEYQSLNLQAEEANAHGRRRDAREFTRRAVDEARRQHLSEAADLSLASSALADAVMRNCDAALAEARTLIPHEPEPDNAWSVAETLAFCGDAAQAENLMNEVSARFPNATSWHATIVPNIEAAIELSRNHPAKALERLASVPADFASIYLEGMAHLRLQRGVEAAAAFQNILDRKGAYANSGRPGGDYGLFYAPSYVGVARGVALARDAARAKKSYQNFFGLWKDADPDVPILIDARKEYAALH